MPVEAYVLVARLGRPERAHADLVDDVVGLPVTVVVEIGAAIARSGGYAGRSDAGTR
jgi:hypothetical protein